MVGRCVWGRGGAGMLRCHLVHRFSLLRLAGWHAAAGWLARCGRLAGTLRPAGWHAALGWLARCARLASTMRRGARCAGGTPRRACCASYWNGCRSPHWRERATNLRSLPAPAVRSLSSQATPRSTAAVVTPWRVVLAWSIMFNMLHRFARCTWSESRPRPPTGWFWCVPKKAPSPPRPRPCSEALQPGAGAPRAG
ncbi:hypothetical protein T492DRAFT_86297 [Pavlovales sp. CCMP2436]|nr:hypothetical protein T492DRAFT_86297 [Pavlovales sp. CCMP2436]